MRRRVLITSLMVSFATISPVLAAEFWVGQDLKSKYCNIEETMPDGKTMVMIGATSYPTRKEAKSAMKAAVAAGQCVKKPKD